MQDRKVITTSVLAAAIVLLPRVAYAHCPLCTIGAGAIAIGATAIGVHSTVVGIFIGAFGLALGLWVGRMVKKKYIGYQNEIIGIASWLLTVIPLRVILSRYTSIYISVTGDYGSWLNRTYLIDYFLIGSVIGAVIMFVSPSISRWVARQRKNEMFPYQGMIITFSLLLIISIILQLSL